MVAAGADVLVHMVQNETLDDEYLALLREKKPYWATVIALGDPVEVCNDDPFLREAHACRRRRHDPRQQASGSD